MTDASGIRTFSYNEYSDPIQDSVTVNGAVFPLVETLDGYGRSIGYILKRGAGGNAQIASWGYAPDGRINSAGFMHSGQNRIFEYNYLAGSNLLETLTMPNGMTLEQSYEAKRDLLADMDYNRGTTLVSRRAYAYDALGRPTVRTLLRQGTTRRDVFSYNGRSELAAATLGTDAYAYDYDNIGNRKTAREIEEEFAYTANELNQYTSIEQSIPDSSLSPREQPFVPTYDADGNQTKIRTATGVWTAEYNALNRPVRFTRTAEDGTVTTVTGDYDYMGRRIFKKVETTVADPETGESTTSVILNHRYLYRGYLQIAALDLTRTTLNALWYILWDPTEPVATRPLAIQTAGSWFVYGWDLTKNVMELYKSNGTIANSYSYAPFGEVTQRGNITNPLQWSSEAYDAELGMVYYNFRFYNPVDGRWISRDPIAEKGGKNLYQYIQNKSSQKFDFMGRKDAEPFPNLDYPLPVQIAKEICDGYKPEKKCCKFGQLMDDDYPTRARTICKNFMQMYSRQGFTSKQVIEVAKCLVAQESQNGEESNCYKRQRNRLVAHFTCYAHAGFIPDPTNWNNGGTLGIPEGGWYLGIFEVLSGTVIQPMDQPNQKPISPGHIIPPMGF